MKKIFYCLVMAIFMTTIAWAGTSTPANNSKKHIISRNGLQPYVSPLLTTKWSQDGGENGMLPYLDTAHTQRPKTGCGPIAVAQIMKYWKSPEHGYGDNFYIWEGPDDPNTILHVDFSQSYYDWDHMISVYKNNSSASQQQLSAIQKLVYDIEVALEVKLNSGATQIEYIHTALKKFFGYNPNMQMYRQINDAYTDDEWLEMIYKEISAGRPVIIGGTHNGYNHIFIADGYDEDGKVHLNLGHANRGGEDRYYDLCRKDETYTTNMRMIIGIQPTPLDTPVTTVSVNTPGTLGECLNSMGGAKRVTRLKVKGSINPYDLLLLDTLAWTTNGQLSLLDLSECNIQNNTLPDNTFCKNREKSYTLQEILLPDNLKSIGNNAFYMARWLYSVHLPGNLKSMGKNAFNDCRYLSSLELPRYLNISSTSYPLDGLKLDTLKVDPYNEYLQVVNGALLTKDGHTMLGLPVKRYGTYKIPGGVKTVYGNISQNCVMTTSIVFPASVEDVTWPFEKCYQTHDVYCHALVAPSLNTSLAENALNITLHVPKGLIEDYQAKGWGCFNNIVDDVDLSPTEIIESNGYNAYVSKMLSTSWTKEDNALAACFPQGTSAELKPSGAAVAMAQVMKYYRYPDRGTGQLSFAYPINNSTHVNFSADFKEKAILWDSMRDSYTYSSTNENDEAAKLVYQCAVATFNKHLPKSGDKASQLQYCSTALKKYFGYNQGMRILNARFYERQHWLTLLYGQLSEGRPVVVEYCENNDEVFVIDGYDQQGMLHVVGLKDNSYLPSDDPKIYSDYVRMLVDITTHTSEEGPTIVRVDIPGTLRDLLGARYSTITNLVVEGTINDDDISLLNSMSCIDSGQLYKLDIRAKLENDEVKGYAFQKCDMLQYVILSERTKSIGRHSFSYCHNMIKVDGLSSVTSIGNYSFFYCRYLDDVNLSGIQTMGDNPLAYNKITNLMVNSGNNQFMLDGLTLFDKEKTTIYSVMGTEQGSYTVPNGVTTIRNMALRGCDEMTEVWIPATVKNIGQYAFYECYNLSDVYCYGQEAPSLSSSSSGYAFYPESSHATVHVPQGCIEEYRQKGWGNFAVILDDMPSDGDVDGDGETNIVDVMLVVNHILGHVQPTFNPLAADTDHDGAINIVDVMSIVNLILRN